jgi:DNA-directed RNA polymerase specialized sigma54-like protein
VRSNKKKTELPGLCYSYAVQTTIFACSDFFFIRSHGTWLTTLRQYKLRQIFMTQCQLQFVNNSKKKMEKQKRTAAKINFDQTEI